MKGPYDGFWTGFLTVMYGAIVWDSIKSWWHNRSLPPVIKTLGIPPKVTLRKVLRTDEGWILVTVHSRSSEPYEQRIMLLDDGTAYRIDVRGDGGEENVRVM